MKVIYVSFTDLKGGAARGAYRLHRGFLSLGIDSELVVRKKYSDDYTVNGPKSILRQILNITRPALAKILLRTQKTSNKIIHSINFLPTGLHKHINRSDADLVVLHWVGSETISISEIGKIKKPIVWRLADQWAFCGAEHYAASLQDRRFIEGYSSNNRPPGHCGLDIDQWTWKRKVKHLKNKNIIIVTGSKWLAQCVKSSLIFKNNRVEVIPSGIDPEVFKPVKKQVARNILNLPQDRKLILFGSMSATSDKRKGFHLLLPALRKFSEFSRAKTTAIVFGASRPEIVPDFGMPSQYLSTLQDDWSLVLAYSAADVFVLPTMLDNLPFTVIEAMACKTPCVSFNVGGLSDLIIHKKNGYLAKPFNINDFAQGIHYIIDNDIMRRKMAEFGREHVLKKCDVYMQSQRYIKLFNSIIS